MCVKETQIKAKGRGLKVFSTSCTNMKVVVIKTWSGRLLMLTADVLECGG